MHILIFCFFFSFRPADRSGKDIDIIFSRLRKNTAFAHFPSKLLHQISSYGYFEELEENIILFRQGDIGTNWYAILSGTVVVKENQDNGNKSPVSIG